MTDPQIIEAAKSFHTYLELARHCGWPIGKAASEAKRLNLTHLGWQRPKHQRAPAPEKRAVPKPKGKG